MPKDSIDYSNTVIYTLSCNDESIHDVYVGHTTNYSQRKYQHKICSQKNTSTLYQFIRQHGGWENWTMTEIAKYDCKNMADAKRREAHHIQQLGASLNTLVSLPYASQKDGAFGAFSASKKTPDFKNCLYACPDCQFVCSKKSDWTRHLTRQKHLAQTTTKTPSNSEHGVTPYGSDLHSLTHLVLEVVKQNKELIMLNNETQKQNQELTNKLVVMCGTTNNTQFNHSNNNTHNSNNKTFNLNVFLNETCKDAMNINDFVDSLQLQLSDLEDVGKLGFVEGISNIIIKNLKALDIHKRPVHCADKKREVIYIKDEDKWEKENEQKQRLRAAIKRVAIKNEKLLPKYKELHPGCNYSESNYADHYSKLVIEAMGGMGNNDLEKQDKIIRNIAREVVIDKCS
ncbi:MAG: GIY-YIG nuclease family protein [Flavobacterium sp.]